MVQNGLLLFAVELIITSERGNRVSDCAGRTSHNKASTSANQNRFLAPNKSQGQARRDHPDIVDHERARQLRNELRAENGGSCSRANHDCNILEGFGGVAVGAAAAAGAGRGVAVGAAAAAAWVCYGGMLAGVSPTGFSFLGHNLGS